MTTNAPVQELKRDEVAFPSAEFTQRLDVLKDKQQKLKDGLAGIEHKIELIKKNRGILELDGRDWQAEVKTLEAEQRRIESAMPGAKGDIQELFSAEFKRHAELRNGLWLRGLRTIVQPHLEKLNRVKEIMRDAVHALDADAHGDALGDIDTFESQCRTYNELARQNLVGLNLLIPMSPGDSLRHSVSQAMKENLKKFLNEPACAELREVLSQGKKT